MEKLGRMRRENAKARQRVGVGERRNAPWNRGPGKRMLWPAGASGLDGGHSLPSSANAGPIPRDFDRKETSALVPSSASGYGSASQG